MFEVATKASHQQLIEYKKLFQTNNKEIDDECCWGVAYQVHKYVWEQEVQERQNHKMWDGIEEKTMTFYPSVRDDNITNFNSTVSTGYLTLSEKI